MDNIYVMKLVLFYKGSFIDSNFIKLPDDKYLFDRAELFWTGQKFGDCEIKAVPVTTKSQDKLLLVDTETVKGQWYIKHSFNPYEGFSDLIRKGYRFLQQTVS